MKVLLLMFISVNLHAANLDSVRNQISELNSIAGEEMVLTNDQAKDLEDLLIEAKDILITAKETKITCSMMEGQPTYNNAEKVLKELAEKEMKLGSWATKSYVKKWMKAYACKTITQYKKQFKYVQGFAYDFKGLKMQNGKKAARYAKDMVGNICIKADLYALFQNALTHAQALNLEKPREIAQKQMEKEGFQCQIDNAESQIDF